MSCAGSGAGLPPKIHESLAQFRLFYVFKVVLMASLSYAPCLHASKCAWYTECAVTILTFPVQFLLSCPVSVQIPHFLTVRALLTVVVVLLCQFSGDASVRDPVAA